jgi:hypothetical protein
MSKRKATFKPLLFTTTVRNPERLKFFYKVLSQFDNQILSDDVINQVVSLLIKKGLYQPMKVNSLVKNKWNQEEDLTDDEVAIIIQNNPQDHKEAGFPKGWASRFDTWFKIGKKLGFVWYEYNEEIIFSESGKMLLDEENPENELLVFANSFAKYQSNNPFTRVLNKNVPLILLLKTIKLLNSDPKFNGAGISRSEIPMLLCWQNDDANSLYEAIKDLRSKHGFTPSNETILAICSDLIEDIKRSDDQLLREYPDDFIRKMRLTGLISLRGGGRFVDLNTKENAAIDYILEKYSEPKVYDDEKIYFDYIGTIDKALISKLSIYEGAVKTTKAELAKWVDFYSWESIKGELLNLANKKKSTDEILKVIEQPLRLEFLTSLAILKKIPDVTVMPNFISDDEGLPTSFAAGGMADIVCKEDNDHVLIEVTLLTGTAQHIRESFSIHRHLDEYKKINNQSYSVMISPKAFIDTKRYFGSIKEKGFEVRVSDIHQFVDKLDSAVTLNEATLETEVVV